MIVSHKHKLIFVKTHKTSTQTFMKFIKPHLGADDVMAGDSSSVVNENTKLNLNKTFPATGKCAAEYVDVYGNHLPWFMIKEIVGDDIWSEYKKITIERDPRDRLVSLFCFLNSILVMPGMFLPSPSAREKMSGPEIKHMLQHSLLELYPEQVRTYFEEINLLQLLSPKLDLTHADTYGPKGVESERTLYQRTATKMNLRVYEVDNTPEIINNKHGVFPYLDTQDICIRLEPFKKHQATEGQCRFLNYGYYHDGTNMQVDHVIDFDNVGDNIGDCFESNNIKIDCDDKVYNECSQNVHYRKKQHVQQVQWWFSGPRGKQIEKLIDSTFVYHK